MNSCRIDWQDWKWMDSEFSDWSVKKDTLLVRILRIEISLICRWAGRIFRYEIMVSIEKSVVIIPEFFRILRENSDKIEFIFI